MATPKPAGLALDAATTLATPSISAATPPPPSLGPEPVDPQNASNATTKKVGNPPPQERELPPPVQPFSGGRRKEVLVIATSGRHELAHASRAAEIGPELLFIALGPEMKAAEPRPRDPR